MSNPIGPHQSDLNTPELISIIEGPPPQFEFVDEQSWMTWQDTTAPYELARCDTRTFNGPKLLKRCHDAWAEKRVVMLEFKDMDGFKQRVEICGIRYEDLGEGTLLQIWVRLPVEMQLIQLADDEEDDDDEIGEDDLSEM